MAQHLVTYNITFQRINPELDSVYFLFLNIQDYNFLKAVYTHSYHTHFLNPRWAALCCQERTDKLTMFVKQFDLVTLNIVLKWKHMFDVSNHYALPIKYLGS